MRIAGLLFLQPLPDRLPAVLLSRQSAALRSQLDFGEHWRAAGTETEHAYFLLGAARGGVGALVSG
jgi:hypothetical protein